MKLVLYRIKKPCEIMNTVLELGDLIYIMRDLPYPNQPGSSSAVYYTTLLPSGKIAGFSEWDISWVCELYVV